jgi:hypothetical protein
MNLSGEALKVKRIPFLATLIWLLLLSGCYVRTSVKSQTRQLPADFSAPVLVVTVQEKTGLERNDLALLEENALQALMDKGINSVALPQAVGEDVPDNPTKLLLAKDYRALLKIVVEFWGSKTQVLQDPVLTSVDSSDTGPESGSTFRSPTSIYHDESVPGPESSYKEVAMAGYLTDLQSSRLVWSARVKARPAGVGRSCLYHSFNRSLEYDNLADRCLKKIAGQLGRIWPKE